MVHGPAARTKIQHGGQRAGDIALGPADSRFKTKALGEICGDGAGEGAAGAMGVGIVDALSLKPAERAPGIQKVVGVVDAVPAFQEHGASESLPYQRRRPLHVLPAFYLHAGEQLRLRDIGGAEIGKGQKFFGKRLHGGVLNEPRAAGGHPYGVHNHILRPVLPELRGDYPDKRRRGYHTDFYGVGPYVLKYSIQLRRQKIGACFHNVSYAGCVLCRQRGYGAHGIDPIHGHRLDVGLNTGASAGIAACD